MIARRTFLFGAAYSKYSAWAQQATFSTDVNVVSLLAAVRDGEGRVVKDLNQADFILQEDGKPQTIRYFSRESDLPLKIGLLVDTSRSQVDVMEPERRASYVFLDQVLRPDKDRAFVAHFDTQVEIVQSFTSSREELRAALDRLSVPGMIATLLYEGIRQTSETMMCPERGRKAFILLSDGVSFRDKTSIVTAIEYAQRADTIIYSILFGGHHKIYRPGGAAIHAMVGGHGKKRDAVAGARNRWRLFRNLPQQYHRGRLRAN
jgi:VWFA-related protein